MNYTPIDITRYLNLNIGFINRIEFLFSSGLAEFTAALLSVEFTNNRTPKEREEWIMKKRRLKKEAALEMSVIFSWLIFIGKRGLMLDRIGAQTLAKNSEDIAATSEIVSLKDSVSLCRIKNPGRSSACPHTQCFDLGVYFTLNEKKDMFKCPVCNQKRAWSTLVFDEFFKEILDTVTSEDDDKIQVEPDGKWEVLKKSGGTTTNSVNVSRQNATLAMPDGPEEVLEKKKARMEKDVQGFLERAYLMNNTVDGVKSFTSVN